MKYPRCLHILKSIVITSLFFGIGSSESHAYPAMIRMNYAQCTACHVSPQGGGILSDYGKSVGASASAFSRDFDPQKIGFYRAISLGGRINHQIQTRTLGYTSELGKRSNDDWFLMQADYLNSTEFLPKLRTDFTVGLVPARQKKRGTQGSGALGENLILRKAMLAYRFNDENEFSLGRDFIPAGLHIDDHTSFIRSLNRRGVTDFPTQLRWDSFSEKWMTSVAAYAPSYEENFKNREWGLAGRGERILTDHFTAGFFWLYGKSPAIRRSVVGLFSRFALTSQWGILGEFQWATRSPEESATSFSQTVGYVRPFWAPLEWLEIGYVAERAGQSLSNRDLIRFQHGPNLNIRIIREVTLLLDGRFLDNETGGSAVKGSLWSFQILGQL